MWLQYAAIDASLSQIALVITALSAAVGIVVTFLKLKPDMTSATLAAQAQFHQQIMEDRNNWRTRALESEAANERYRKELDDCREELERCRSRHAKAGR